MFSFFEVQILSMSEMCALAKLFDTIDNVGQVDRKHLRQQSNTKTRCSPSLSLCEMLRITFFAFARSVTQCRSRWIFEANGTDVDNRIWTVPVPHQLRWLCALRAFVLWICVRDDVLVCVARCARVQASRTKCIGHINQLSGHKSPQNIRREATNRITIWIGFVRPKGRQGTANEYPRSFPAGHTSDGCQFRMIMNQPKVCFRHGIGRVCAYVILWKRLRTNIEQSGFFRMFRSFARSLIWSSSSSSHLVDLLVASQSNLFWLQFGPYWPIVETHSVTQNYWIFTF